jgi:Arylsulfotransferase (ASST)
VRGGRLWQAGGMRQLVLATPVGLLLSLSSAALPQQNEDSPAPRRGLVRNDPEAFQGYTLFAPLNSRTIYLIDMQGQVVHTWPTATSPTGAVYLLPSGHLLREGQVDGAPRFHGGGIGGVIEELDWDGKVVWTYKQADDAQIVHHDIEPLPNGNVLAVVWEHRYREDAIEWGRDPAHVGEEGMWPDGVIEIKPTRPEGGEVVWEWHSWDHLVQDFDRERTNYGQVSDHPERIDINADHRDKPPMTDAQRKEQEELERQMRALGYAGGDAPDAPPKAPGQPDLNPDWLHTNAVDYLPEQDLIVISSPHLSELFVIDHSTTTEEAAWSSGGRFGRGGDVLWRWGNPRNYGCGADTDRRLFGQHNPEWIAGSKPDELRLLVFNNGGDRSDGDYSSADELVLPFDPAKGFPREKGQAFGPTEPAWSYSEKGAFYSGFISGVQRLPGGHTLICSGAQGRVFEVTPQGQVVWDFESPFGGEVAASPNAGQAPPQAIFRATRIAKDHPGLSGKDLAPH